MREARGIALRWIGSAVMVFSAWCSAVPASAQTTTDDAAARKHFEQGRAAFEETDWEQALLHFRDAYRLSHRPQLQYNIGVTADRLQRDEEALQAFESYLEAIENPPREQEVRERIATLRSAIDEKKAAERAIAEAAVAYESDGRKIPKSAIVGSSVLAAAGVAGVVTMGVVLAQRGSCLEEVGGVCQSERAASTWTWVYGAVGVAALAGSATWLVVGRKRAKKKRNTAWMLGPTGVAVAGSF